MAQLRQDYQHLVKLDTEIIAVGPEEAEPFRKYWLKEEMPFIGVPDPKHTIQQLYEQEVNLLKLGRLPSQMLVDKSGMLLYVHYGRSMADIPSNTEILRLIE